MSVKTETQATDCVSQYKGWLLEAQQLKRQSAATLHRRVVLLCQVFADREFRSDLGSVDDFAAATVLDKEVEDTGFEFLQLRAMFQTCPDQATWESESLGTIWQRTLDQRPKTVEDEPIRKRHVISRAEFDEVKRDTLQAKAKAAKLESEVERLRRELREARAKIRELEKENAELRNRLEPTMVPA